MVNYSLRLFVWVVSYLIHLIRKHTRTSFGGVFGRIWNKHAHTHTHFYTQKHTHTSFYVSFLLLSRWFFYYPERITKRKHTYFLIFTTNQFYRKTPQFITPGPLRPLVSSVGQRLRRHRRCFIRSRKHTFWLAV